MNTKEGMTRMAKLVSIIGWVVLVIGGVTAIAQPFSGHSEFAAFVILISISFAAFLAIQGVVWILDGFMGNNGEQSSLLWPYKRRKSAQQREPGIHAEAAIKAPKSNHLIGVHGWLFFLVLSLMVIKPLFGLASTLSNLLEVERQIPNLLNVSRWNDYKSVAWALAWFSAAVVFYTGYRLLRVHRPESVRLAIAVFWIMPVPIMIADTYAAFFYLDLTVGAETSIETLKGLVQWLLNAIVWTAYLKLSRRVRNTYYAGHSIATSQDRGDRIEPTI